MTVQEQNLQEMLRHYAGPVDLYQRYIRKVMDGCGLRPLELPGGDPRIAADPLVFSADADLFRAVFLTASIQDEGSVVLLELARSLSIANPELNTVFVFNAGERLEPFPFLKQDDGYDSYSFVLKLNPPRRYGSGLLTISANDDDPCLPGIVLPRMRHFGISVLYRPGRTRPPEPQARLLQLAYCEPYNLTNMGALALWLEELLFVIGQTRTDYLWEEETIGMPETMDLGEGIFVACFPDGALRLLETEGGIPGGSTSEELRRLFQDEREGGGMGLFA